MTMKFNADEVLEMAVRIEKDGAAFYRKAASGKKDASSVDFLKKLAAMEDDHAATFTKMRSGLTEEEKAGTAYDPMNEASLYLEAMADGHGGEGAPEVTAKLTGKETVVEIIDTAIRLEKESILFYLGLRDMVPARLGKGKIDDIITQEREHIVILAGKRKALAK